MPSLIDIRRRIRAVKNTQQITKAMKMIAASRLRRAHDRIVAARPFSHGVVRVLYSLAGRVDPSLHPLLAARDDRKPGAHVLLIVITSDKGLAGGFSANVIKAAASFIAARKGQRVSLVLIGRKGRDFFRRRGFATRLEKVNVFTHLTFADAEALAVPIIEDFVSGEVDGVYLVYNEFKSMIAQRVVTERLLPVPRLGEDLAALVPMASSPGFNLDRDRDGRIDPGSDVDYLYEPSAQEILDVVMPRYVQYAAVSRAARVSGRRARGAHGRDGRGDEERGRDRGLADAVHEQGAAGGHHPRDHRGGLRGRIVVSIGER